MLQLNPSVVFTSEHWLVHEEATNWAKLVEGKWVPEAGVCKAPLDP